MTPLGGRAAALLVLAAGAAWLPAARASQEEPPPPRDAEVVGVVVAGDGSPAPGARVQVVATDTGISGGLFALFTLGLACLLPETCTASGDEVETTTTDAVGHYAATLPNAYVAGTETDTDWLVTASRDAANGQVAGASSTFEFEVNTARQEAPPLPLWDAPVEAATTGWLATFSAPPPPPGLARAQVTFTTAGGGAVRVPGHVGSIDLRLLEPEAGSGVDSGSHWVVTAATAYADVTVRHAEGRTIYHQRVTTAAPDVGVTSAQLVPTSRGARCSYGFADGSADEVDACGATDGFFRSPVRDTTDAQRPLATVTVALGNMVEVADVFVRGCDGSCAVDASGDGTSWAPLTNDLAASRLSTSPGDESLLVASLRPPLPARFVRVTRQSLSASEVSVWPATPPAPIAPAAAAEIPVGDSEPPTPTGSDGDGSDSPPLVLIVGATVLLTTVAGAALRRTRDR